MNSSALTFVLGLMGLMGLMGTVWSSPTSISNCGPECAPECKPATRTFHLPNFIHVSELKDSSVAPWDISTNNSTDREPHSIRYAECKDCTVEHMVAKPINILVSVYKKIGSGSCVTWCKCPFELAVGCTCVKKQ